MKKKTVAIDVDLVTIDPIKGDFGWFNWLIERSSKFDVERYFMDKILGKIDYNLSGYFTLEGGVDPMDFWQQSDLYQNFTPDMVVTDSILELSEVYNIVFVSYCKSGHFKSKFKFLSEHFPYLDGFIATKEKGFVKCDVAIDDRLEYLSLYDDDVYKILFNTEYAQYSDFINYHECTDWLQVVRTIKEVL